MSVIAASSGDPAVARLLQSHPRVAFEAGGPTTGLVFRQGHWGRSVRVDDRAAELRGILEIIDNNPLVCADEVSVPGPGATLAAIALGPLAAASLIVEAPTFLVTVPTTEDEVDAFLRPMGWSGGTLVHVEPQELGSVVAGTAMVAIDTPEDLDDLDAVYGERYDRAFFVRRDEASPWDVSLVAGKPYAVYRLRIAPDQPRSLLTIRVLADLGGKAGAAQVVHAMNVMAGLEESLGIS